VHIAKSGNTFKTVFVQTEVQTAAETPAICKLFKAHSCSGAGGKAGEHPHHRVS